MIILVSGTVSVIAVNIHSALPLVPNAVWWMHRLLLFLHCLEENVFHSTRMKKNELQVVYNLHLIHVRLVCCVKIVLHLFRPLSCDDDFLYWSVPHFHPITFVKHFDLTVYSQRWAYNKICKSEYFLPRLLCTKFHEWHAWCLSESSFYSLVALISTSKIVSVDLSLYKKEMKKIWSGRGLEISCGRTLYTQWKLCENSGAQQRNAVIWARQSE